MALHYLTFDVFTKFRFRGNPLAIVRVPAGTDLSQNQKQLIAREFNLSETVFLHEQNSADWQALQARINIFTPIAEVPFAGHPTIIPLPLVLSSHTLLQRDRLRELTWDVSYGSIGTSTYLLHHLHLDSAKVLLTKAGPLPFQDSGDGAQLAVAHNFHLHDRPFKDRPEFGHYPVASIVNGMNVILARLPDLESLAKPTKSLLGTENTYSACEALDEGWRNGPVISYFYVDLGLDSDGSTRKLRTRNLGSIEDPGTGSAASALCSFLTLTEKGSLLTRKYHITQGVEMGRQSEICVQVTVNGAMTGIEEVLLSGTAVKVSEGEIEIPQL